MVGRRRAHAPRDGGGEGRRDGGSTPTTSDPPRACALGGNTGGGAGRDQSLPAYPGPPSVLQDPRHCGRIHVIAPSCSGLPLRPLTHPPDNVVPFIVQRAWGGAPGRTAPGFLTGRVLLLVLLY